MTKKLKHRCNSIASMRDAVFSEYDGVEVDVVWYDRRLVVNHEHGGRGELLETILLHLPTDKTIAINVKEYGMAVSLRVLLENYSREYFIFDVPGPELDQYGYERLRVYGRWSEYEHQRSSWGHLVDSFLVDPQFVKTAALGGDPIALISSTLRGTREWSSDILALAQYVITK